MEERINEIVRLIDTQLAIVPDNPIEESYKARTLASYVQALNGLKILNWKDWTKRRCQNI